MRSKIDLGDGHTFSFVGRHGESADLKWGAIVTHKDKRNPELECQGGYITFDGSRQRAKEPDAPKWTVISYDPITLDPSLSCSVCGDHGWIRNGVWEAV